MSIFLILFSLLARAGNAINASDSKTCLEGLLAHVLHMRRKHSQDIGRLDNVPEVWHASLTRVSSDSFFKARHTLKAFSLLLSNFNSTVAWRSSGMALGLPSKSQTINGARYYPQVLLLAKAKTKKKKKPGTKSGSGGFAGFGASSKPPDITLTGVDPSLLKNLAAKAFQLSKSPKKAQDWLDLGSMLISAREFAEAERVYRVGAWLAPENEMLCGMATGLCGDSEFYYHGTPSARPSVISSALLPPLNESFSDDGFDAFTIPPHHLLRQDPMVDRSTDWGDDGMSRGVVFQSRHPVVSPSEAAWVIEQAEQKAAEEAGWTKSRHTQAATTDFPVLDLPEVHKWFNKKLKDELFPMVHARYPTLIASPDEIRVFEAFVVRYDAAGQASLPMHLDSNTFSLTIALNDKAEYENGGVVFAEARPVEKTVGKYEQTILNADAGGAVIFPGKAKHGGNAITKGRRYIITLFINIDVNHSGRKPGWLFDQFNLQEAPPEAAEALKEYARKQIEKNIASSNQNDQDARWRVAG